MHMKYIKLEEELSNLRHAREKGLSFKYSHNLLRLIKIILFNYFLLLSVFAAICFNLNDLVNVIGINENIKETLDFLRIGSNHSQDIINNINQKTAIDISTVIYSLSNTATFLFFVNFLLLISLFFKTRKTEFKKSIKNYDFKYASVLYSILSFILFILFFLNSNLDKDIIEAVLMSYHIDQVLSFEYLNNFEYVYNALFQFNYIFIIPLSMFVFITAITILHFLISKNVKNSVKMSMTHEENDELISNVKIEIKNIRSNMLKDDNEMRNVSNALTNSKLSDFERKCLNHLVREKLSEKSDEEKNLLILKNEIGHNNILNM